MTERGQAMIESLLLGLILVMGLLWCLQTAVKTQKNFMLDEFVEQALICLLQNNSACTHQLHQQLKAQGYQDVWIQSQKIQNKFILRLKALSAFNEKIEKESELEYDVKIQY